MLRKLLLAAAVTAGVAATAAPASAFIGYPQARHHVRYVVLERCGWQWKEVACYPDRCDADREAARLSHCGHHVRVECR